ncbi:MAG: hypothetical protein JNL40_13495 [Cyclobacteriaceae bacterium]|nr:hypothetical protein [Cyclobacteriaceae bacterium]
MRLPYACLLGVFLAACSSPRYTYYFPQPGSLPIEPTSDEQVVRTTPPEEHALHASTEKIVTPSQRITKYSRASQKPSGVSAPATMAVTRAQPVVQAAPPDTASLSDSTFRLSLIFFVGGLIVWIIGGPVFTVIGTLAMLTGVVFGIKWFYKK